MKIYQKLSDARAKFHSMKLKKTGHNKFAQYYYFELGDFLIPALGVFKEHDLCAHISFGTELAVMKIVDLEDGETIEITSPMSTAALKGCHEVQNLGAVQTYLRRYLWVAALEIVEHDAIDSSQPIEDRKVQPMRHSPLDTSLVDSRRMSLIADVADSVRQHFSDGDVIGAYEEASGITDVEEKQALWNMLDSKVRAALKKHGDSLKETN